MLGPSAFSYSGGFGASLKRSQTDLLHQHGLWCYPSITGRRWAEAHSTPRVISPHNMLDSVSLKKGAWRKRIALKLYEKRNIDTAGCIHALVEKEGYDIREQGFKAPICIVPNGIEVPQTQALPDHLSAIVGGQPYLLYLSRLTEVKQVLPLMEAW